ncbi:hypothetical protein HHK36_000014 [Tetracentron sinense]|uniref:Uncharacterized protein n=1 Tax=Tetracentron sinense TaxID=13715 RepID=A0A834ZRI5_TETSI|nr:hypothetical protein HHK36_000014 [Tetracentron sinense]
MAMATENLTSLPSDQVRREYRVCLIASTDCIQFILRQGLAFHGHDESKDLNDKGDFLELLQFLVDHNENFKLTTPDIQKDIGSATAIETTNTIINEVGDSLFAVLIYESSEISIKEQMVVLRYVDKREFVTEHFLGIVHVTEPTVVSLKAAIDKLFSKNGLSITRLCGQGYDGASNMQGEFNDLKTLIMKENECVLCSLLRASPSIGTYCVEFSALNLMALDNQLETYIIDMHSNGEFLEVKGISDLAGKMVKKIKKSMLYPLVYLLVTLALILPIATTTVERVFSAIKIIKNQLRNRMGDEWMTDCLVTYIEKDIFNSIDNEAILQ